MSPTTSALSIRDQKSQLRKIMRARLRQIATKDIVNQSEDVTKKLLSLPQYLSGHALSVYLSMPGREIDTHAFVRQALKDGKEVFVPYLHEALPEGSRAMDMLELRSERDLDSLEPDAWKIPTLDSKSTSERKNALGGFGISNNELKAEIPALDMIIMPGLAFDHGRGRLGHGKGFYDRYLERCKRAAGSESGVNKMPFLVGLALQQQLLPAEESVPRDGDDWLVDEVLTSQ